MRFIYADPGLSGTGGHHANVCQSIMDELRARGILGRVLAFVDVDPQIRGRLGAIPFFRYNLYWRSDQDPLCGPAYAFHGGGKATQEDLNRISDLAPDDVLFVPWASPAIFWGVVQWMSDLPPHRLPQVIVHFLDIPDVTLQWHETELRLGLPDYRIEPSAMFLRLAAKHITAALGQRLRLACSHPEGVAALKAVLGVHVESLPAMQHAVTGCRRRGGAAPIVIGMVGHQRGYAKGVQYMPQLVEGILQSNPTTRFLIHDCSDDLLPEVRTSLLRIAADDSRVSLHIGPVGSSEWASLLEKIDLVLCPYSRQEYRLMSSGVHNEAIANAIPSVVPSETTLSSAAREFCDCSVEFGTGEPASILAAARVALGNFERLADAAHRGAAKWREINGPTKFVDALLRNRHDSRLSDR